MFEKIKDLFLLKEKDNNRRFIVADSLKLELENALSSSCNSEKFDIFISILDENEDIERLELLSSTIIKNNHKVMCPKAVDKISIVYLSKNNYFNNDICIYYMKNKNFILFFYIKCEGCKQCRKILDELFKG